MAASTGKAWGEQWLGLKPNLNRTVDLLHTPLWVTLHVKRDREEITLATCMGCLPIRRANKATAAVKISSFFFFLFLFLFLFIFPFLSFRFPLPSPSSSPSPSPCPCPSPSPFSSFFSFAFQAKTKQEKQEGLPGRQVYIRFRSSSPELSSATSKIAVSLARVRFASVCSHAARTNLCSAAEVIACFSLHYRSQHLMRLHPCLQA